MTPLYDDGYPAPPLHETAMPTEKRQQQQWTPGPWAFHRTHRASADAWFVIVDPNGSGPIVDVGGDEMSGQIAEAKYLITDPNIIEANARLIAQAPALYQALRELATSLRRMSQREASIDIMQAACDSLACKAEAALLAAEGGK